MTLEEEFEYSYLYLHRFKASLVVFMFCCVVIIAAVPCTIVFLFEHIHNKYTSGRRWEYTKRLLWIGIGHYIWDDLLALSPVLFPMTIAKCHNRFEVSPSDKRVVLTIDDAPGTSPKEMEKLLNVLKEHNAKATFFCTTDYIINSNNNAMETLMQRAVAEGHELGNHMTKDKSYFNFDEDEFENDLLQAEKILSRFDTSRLSENPPQKWFRPPMGQLSKNMVKVLEKHQFKIALGNVYSNDPWIGGENEPPHPKDVQYHYEFMKRRVKPGSVIIFHTPNAKNRRQTVLVLDKLLPFLSLNGISCVTCSSLDACTYAQAQENFTACPVSENQVHIQDITTS